MVFKTAVSRSNARGCKKGGDLTKTIGYIRVSSNSQDVDNQRLAILDYARLHKLTIATFWELTISSRKDTKARRIDELLETLEPKDTLVVAELSRLGRSVGQLVSIVDALVENKIRFIAIKENIVLEANGQKDMQATVMVTLFSLFAEIERRLISERTKNGLEAARAKGKILGRPKGPGKSKLDPHREEIIALLNNGSTITFVARRYGCSTRNLSIWLKKRGI